MPCQHTAGVAPAQASPMNRVCPPRGHIRRCTDPASCLPPSPHPPDAGSLGEVKGSYPLKDTGAKLSGGRHGSCPLPLGEGQGEGGPKRRSSGWLPSPQPSPGGRGSLHLAPMPLREKGQVGAGPALLPPIPTSYSIPSSDGSRGAGLSCGRPQLFRLRPDEGIGSEKAWQRVTCTRFRWVGCSLLVKGTIIAGSCRRK